MCNPGMCALLSSACLSIRCILTNRGVTLSNHMLSMACRCSCVLPLSWGGMVWCSNVLHRHRLPPYWSALSPLEYGRR